MNASEFLGRFADVPDGQLCKLRRSSRLDEWPDDQSLYLNVTKQLFPGPLGDRERRRRFVRILHEFLYYDGRTFEALMYIAEQASQHPEEYGNNGVNALAGIYYYLNMNRPAPTSDEELVARFELYADIDELSSNAWHCWRVIARRRPELRSKVVDRPID